MEPETRKTWIDPEEYAYPSGTLRQSTRRGMVRCADGIIRKVLLSVPDTFFSIPARVYAYGKTIAGFVTCDSESGEYLFHAYLNRKNAHVIPEKKGETE